MWKEPPPDGAQQKQAPAQPKSIRTSSCHFTQMCHTTTPTHSPHLGSNSSCISCDNTKRERRLTRRHLIDSICTDQRNIRSSLAFPPRVCWHLSRFVSRRVWCRCVERDCDKSRAEYISVSLLLQKHRKGKTSEKRPDTLANAKDKASWNSSSESNVMGEKEGRPSYPAENL